MTCYFMKRRRCGMPPSVSGLRRGVTQCVMLPNRALGFLSFSRSSLRCSSFTYDEVELRLQLLARESLSALTRFEDDMVMAPEMRFSKREKEILKWTAEGRPHRRSPLFCRFLKIPLTSIRKICRRNSMRQIKHRLPATLRRQV